MRKPLSLIVAFCLIFTLMLTGCGEDTASDPSTQTEQVTIAGIKGPTSIGMIQLIDKKALDGETFDDTSYTVDYMVAESADILTGKLINDEIQIAALPTNVASVLFNKTDGNIVVLAEQTLGILYLVGRDDISSIDGLEGKTIAISGSGNVPQYAADYILEQNGLTGKVNLEYYTDHASASQVLLAGDADLAILPQPFVTQVIRKDSNVKILLDLTKEWEKASKGESTLSMGCLISTRTFAENHPEFVSELLSRYKQSVAFVNESPAEAARLVADNNIIEDAQVTEQAIPYCNIVFKSAQEAKEEISQFLNVLYKFEPSSIGGALPDDSFYYTEP